MTEAEWLTCDDPEAMLRAMVRPATQRRMRLFACACCRRVEGHAPADSREAIGFAERYADGSESKLALLRWRDRLKSLHENLPPRGNKYITEITAQSCAALAICQCLVDRFIEETDRSLPRQDLWAAQAASRVFEVMFALTKHRVPLEHRLKARRAEEAIQSRLARDIFGIPFRPVTFDQAWRTPTVVALAGQMYESRDFGAIPILADALQDAGCGDDSILDHCRSGSVHVRGCWVVDLLLGKE